MQVIATAGHVDHGKSTLMRALTGMEPDRWTQERARGLTIDLGFVWAEFVGTQLAFVDVPGHERFVANMLAGAGPVTAVLFVVAADEGWQAQSSEHLAALDALGVRHGVLAVTKADLADPQPAIRQAREHLADTAIGQVPAVAVSGRTGAGLAGLRRALATLAAGLPEPDTGADVRLWIDRAFTVRGAGTVVTGTLGAGTVRAGDELALARSGQRVQVRGVQALGEDAQAVPAVARVALNLRRTPRQRLRRGDALLTPGSWLTTGAVDVRLRAGQTSELHREYVLHLGSAAVPVRVRPLGMDTARLRLASPLPLRCGDRGLLRDPGEHRIAAGLTVLDVRPPEPRGRGWARARAAELSGGQVAEAQLRDRVALPAAELRAMGLPAAGVPVAGWVVDEGCWKDLPWRAGAALAEWAGANPLASGMPAEAMRAQLGVPAEVLTEALARAGMRLAGGLVLRTGEEGAGLPEGVEKAVREVLGRLEQQPFRAPQAAELDALGLGTRELAAASRQSRVTRLAGQLVLGPDALTRAADVLAALPQPFTVSQARAALDTTRRVAVPLLERLDAERTTIRHADNTRSVR